MGPGGEQFADSLADGDRAVAHADFAAAQRQPVALESAAQHRELFALPFCHLYHQKRRLAIGSRLRRIAGRRLFSAAARVRRRGGDCAVSPSLAAIPAENDANAVFFERIRLAVDRPIAVRVRVCRVLWHDLPDAGRTDPRQNHRDQRRLFQSRQRAVRSADFCADRRVSTPALQAGVLEDAARARHHGRRGRWNRGGRPRAFRRAGVVGAADVRAGRACVRDNCTAANSLHAPVCAFSPRHGHSVCRDCRIIRL